MKPTSFKVYIPKINFSTVKKKRLFLLVRPFLGKACWQNSLKQKEQWGINNSIIYTPNIEEADIILLPKPVNSYSKLELKEYSDLCLRYNLNGYAYILGDLGRKYPYFKNLIYFRNGGFKKQLPNNNIGFPTLLPDAVKNLYKSENIEIRNKTNKPVISFCGHADNSIHKKWKDYFMFTKKNISRFFKNPFTNNYEPFFASAFERFILLKKLERSNNKIETRFYYKNQYKGGRENVLDKKTFTYNYYETIRNSDYVLCLRGAGNFSVRFYETLMMGRIPVFIDTDCLLPFEKNIIWDNHLVRIPWKDRGHITDILLKYHQNLTDEEFVAIQIRNRKLWKETLSIAGIFNFLVNLPKSKN